MLLLKLTILAVAVFLPNHIHYPHDVGFPMGSSGVLRCGSSNQTTASTSTLQRRSAIRGEEPTDRTEKYERRGTSSPVNGHRYGESPCFNW